jgi:metal-responsive CopG/Arc/MetJ family transcriptional regulator
MLSVKVDADLYKDIEQLCKALEMSRSQLIRILLVMALTEIRASAEPEKKIMELVKK